MKEGEELFKQYAFPAAGLVELESGAEIPGGQYPRFAIGVYEPIASSVTLTER